MAWLFIEFRADGKADIGQQKGLPHKRTGA
jgi:hypothetical protein